MWGAAKLVQATSLVNQEKCFMKVTQLLIAESLRVAQMADCNYLFVVKNPQVTQMLMYDLAHCSQA